VGEGEVLIATAATIAFLHTLLGPDHYVAFIAMGRARRWGLGKTLRITALCGLAHVMSSVLIGAAGILIGAELLRLVAIESGRGTLAGWLLLAFGLAYLARGVRQIGRRQSHSHVHRHGDLLHCHEHDHRHDHAHVHATEGSASLTPWALFVIFVLGPCEALIPLFMYPAAQQNNGLVVAVALVFGVVTLGTMLAAVAIGLLGLDRLLLPRLERYGHAIAGAAIVACGAAINFAGL